MIELLAKKAEHQDTAENLSQELTGITVLVARKFTNDRTADGLLDAFYLSIGCISLGLGQADIPQNDPSRLSFLLQQGAEQLFQMGFRHIKTLASLPAQTMLADFDNDPYIQQRNLKSLFYELCRADPSVAWTADNKFNQELLIRQENQTIVACAKWLRKNNFSGPIIEDDLDANAVIAIAVIFSIHPEGRIVARTGQKEIENLIRRTRATPPDIEAVWPQWLKKISPEYQSLLRTRMEEYKGTIVKKILSRTAIKTLVTEIQDCYAGVEQDVDYD
ncbi:MAG: hypothetical protein R8K48_02940 [Gallionella sp.]